MMAGGNGGKRIHKKKSIQRNIRIKVIKRAFMLLSGELLRCRWNMRYSRWAFTSGYIAASQIERRDNTIQNQPDRLMRVARAGLRERNKKSITRTNINNTRCKNGLLMRKKERIILCIQLM